MSEYERVIKSGVHHDQNFDATIIGWKIYYTDGSIASSLDTTWDNANSVDVAVVLLFYAQKYPLFLNGVETLVNYRVILDEGSLFWRRVINGVETFGQCDVNDTSLISNPFLGEIKEGGLYSGDIWKSANHDRVW